MARECEDIGLDVIRIRVKPDVPFKIECCDCGLTHINRIVSVGKKDVVIEMSRDEDSTSLSRLLSKPLDELVELRDELTVIIRKRRSKQR